MYPLLFLQAIWEALLGEQGHIVKLWWPMPASQEDSSYPKKKGSAYWMCRNPRKNLFYVRYPLALRTLPFLNAIFLFAIKFPITMLFTRFLQIAFIIVMKYLLQHKILCQNITPCDYSSMWVV